jgi:hypothetical protein
MPEAIIKVSQCSEAHYLGIAVDLMGAMLGMVELLKCTGDADGSADLIQRAKALALRLSGELEELASMSRVERPWH